VVGKHSSNTVLGIDADGIARPAKYRICLPSRHKLE